jgi:hypothetical protein
VKVRAENSELEPRAARRIKNQEEEFWFFTVQARTPHAARQRQQIAQHQAQHIAIIALQACSSKESVCCGQFCAYFRDCW